MDVPEDRPVKKGTLAYYKAELFRYSAESAREGGFITQKQLAMLCGISPQAVANYIARGKISTFEFFGHKYISSNDALAFATREKLKGGRPSKTSLIAAGFSP